MVSYLICNERKVSCNIFKKLHHQRAFRIYQSIAIMTDFILVEYNEWEIQFSPINHLETSALSNNNRNIMQNFLRLLTKVEQIFSQFLLKTTKNTNAPQTNVNRVEKVTCRNFTLKTNQMKCLTLGATWRVQIIFHRIHWSKFAQLELRKW